MRAVHNRVNDVSNVASVQCREEYPQLWIVSDVTSVWTARVVGRGEEERSASGSRRGRDFGDGTTVGCDARPAPSFVAESGLQRLDRVSDEFGLPERRAHRSGADR